MFCTKCGNELKEGEDFCTKCGKETNYSVDRKLLKNNIISSKNIKYFFIGLSIIMAISLVITISNKQGQPILEQESTALNTQQNTSNQKPRPTNDIVIGCAKTALREIATYEPEIGTTEILEKDDYGRYLVSCYAKLVNGFGAGKYYVYYIVLSEVYSQDGEWYYRINPANGIINSANYGENEKLAIESAKTLNAWNEPKDEPTEITELKLNNLDYDIDIKSDTSMQVTETWNISIKDNNTLFKTFTLDNSKYKGISNVKVYEILDNGDKKEFENINKEMYYVTKDCYYGLVNSKGEFEIAWGVDTKNQIKTYQISYTVDEAIKVYNDCAELYWQLISSNFSIPIDKVEGSITVNNSNIDNVKVWGHSKNEGSINKQGNKIIFSTKNIKPNDYLEVRLAIPKEGFNSTNTINKDMLNQIYNEEKSN